MSLETTATIFALFLKEMDELGHSSHHTLRAYKKDFEQVFEKTQHLPLPSEENLLKKIKETQILWGKLQPATRQRKAATMKSFLRWLFEKKYISSPLNDRIEAPQVPRKIPHFLSIDEVLHLLKFAQQQNPKESKNNFCLSLIYLLYGGGLRVSEACNLRWSRLRLKTSEVSIMGKGKKERWVALPLAVTHSLQQLPMIGEYIWGDLPLQERTAYEWVRQLGKSAGLRAPLHPHALRHSYATHLVSGGMNLRTLQELMGHSSLTSTEKYMHLSLDQLSRTLDAHHPLGNPQTQRSLKNG